MIAGFENLLRGTGVTVTCATADSSFPAANLARADRRRLPARSTGITDTRWVVDFLTATSVTLLHVLDVNAATVRVQGNATDVWTAPSFDQTLAVKQNPFNEQWSHTVVPVGFNYRYLGLFLPAQTPVKAPTAQFSVGGLHASTGVAAPTGFSVDLAHAVHHPVEDTRPAHGGWRQRAYLDEKYVTLKAERRARFTHATPYVATDEAVKWLLNIDAAAWRTDFFVLWEDLGNPTMGWLVRRIGETATWEPSTELPGVVQLTGGWELEEVS